MLRRLADATERQRMIDDIQDPHADWENLFLGSGGADGIQISALLDPQLRRHVGRRLSAIAREQNAGVFDTLFELLLADNGSTDAIYFTMDEIDVRTALASPLTSVCTDSSARAVDGPLADAIGHPRGWGSFPKILGQYVREERLLSLESAVHKMTGLPAQRLGLTDRGLVKTGYFADLAIFDPATIADRSTYQESRRYPLGIEHVLINGQWVVAHGQYTGRLAGRPLTKHGG